MKKMNFLATLLLTMMLTCTWAHAINVIPQPKSMQKTKQQFELKPSTKIIYSEELKENALMVSDMLSPSTGWDFELQQASKPKKHAINLILQTDLPLSAEAYQLSVTNNQVQIKAKTQKGIVNGTQTLIQLLPEAVYNKCRQKNTNWTIPGVEIEDAPAYSWRGMMLDVSRYFYEKEYVLHFIDIMAMYKMNVLHLHLIDDAGWRIEIKKYPKLTSIGGFRGEGKDRVGGYYTQEDIKEIVAYASARNIEVIPEIEVPAHTLAAIAAYPELSCTGKPQKVQTKHSISRELYCVGKKSTFDFLADVFAEVTALFPSQYIHIGGDEARYDRWQKCPDCQALKNRLGLKTEKQLQVYFNIEMQKMLKQYNKTIVGWDEIIEDGLTEKVVGMVWYNKKKAISGVKAGHNMVMAFVTNCYFDVAESRIPGEVKAATWLPPISLKKAYDMNPMVEGIDEKYRKQVLGGHGCLWTDQFIHGDKLPRIEPINENRAERYLDYLALPRMAALAEALWCAKEDKNWDNFQQRMKSHYTRYNHANYGFRVPQPQLLSKKKTEEGYQIQLQNIVDGAHITYTTDGTRANTYSTTYTQPFTVKNLTDFQAMTVLNRRQFSLPLYFPKKYDKYKKHGKLIAEWKPKDIKGKVYSNFEMNATGKINSNGAYEVAFFYTDGTIRLDISGIEIFKNGKKVAEDIHFGYTGNSKKDNVYKFNIESYETGAAFTIKARIRGDQGNDSHGAIFIDKK